MRTDNLWFEFGSKLLSLIFQILNFYLIWLHAFF